MTPLGGYPGTDDEGRTLQRQRDRGEMTEDFIAAVEFLRAHPGCNGKMGAVGFCFGGGMCNALAVRLGDKLAAAVPFYGRQPAAEVDYTAHMYADANHGFHTDTTPRYDQEQAKLAWQRTIDFFNAKLRADLDGESP